MAEITDSQTVIDGLRNQLAQLEAENKALSEEVCFYRTYAPRAFRLVKEIERTIQSAEYIPAITPNPTQIRSEFAQMQRVLNEVGRLVVPHVEQVPF